jgi:hypothetical protein
MTVTLARRYWPYAVAGVLVVALFPFALVFVAGAAAGADTSSCGGQAPAVAGKYSQADISALWIAAGGPPEQAEIAGAVGMAESGGDPNVVNSIGAGGLMQIHPPEPNYLDPQTNMRIAVRKWRESGWQPWEAYTNGRYLQFLGKGGPVPGVAFTDCGSLEDLVAEADRMIALHQPYVWGGGHAAFSADGPWDCSGAISQLLHHLGMLDGAPLDSTGLMSWGAPGRGKDFTVYANPDHVFLIVERGEHQGDAWGTASRDLEGQPGSGPLWHHHTTAGFTARHWEPTT